MKTEARGNERKLEIRHKERKDRKGDGTDKLELYPEGITWNYDKVTFVSE